MFGLFVLWCLAWVDVVGLSHDGRFISGLSGAEICGRLLICMQTSNDNDLSEPMGLSSLGVADLDTSIVPDVFGLQAFDPREPISWMLPGQFQNTLWVLVPDAAASPLNFHDIF